MRLPRTLAIIALLGSSLLARAGAPGIAHFITASGDKLWDGDREFRYVSVNMPDALQIICQNRFDADFAADRFRLPDEYELRDCVRTVRQMGGQVMRAFVITCRRGYHPDAMFDVSADPVIGNEDALQVLDKLLQLCNEEGVRVYLPLVAGNSPVIRGDLTTYGPDFWTVGSPTNRKFKNMVAQLLRRQNRFTGVRYCDDKAVFGWETANEFEIGDDPVRKHWLHDFAAYLRRLDPNHLVIDGRNNPKNVFDKYDEFLADPNIGMLSYHTYRSLPGKSALETLRAMRAYTRGRKPMIVGEISMNTPLPELAGLLDEIIADGTCGANYWGNRFRNRDGGFYKHSDRGSLYEDLDWPGFVDGATHADQTRHEREVENLLADRAYKIQGRARPPLPIPASAVLLPIGDPGHITWQGPTGARNYDVERSETAGGPWVIVGAGVQDNLTAYVPVFADGSAEPGHAYYYRVIAKNESGAAAASNAIGPVEVHDRWLVDELEDLTHASAASNLSPLAHYRPDDYGGERSLIGRERDTAPATLEYHVADDIAHGSVWIHHVQADAQLSVSADGKTFVPLSPAIFPYEGGLRRKYAFSCAERGARILRITLPADAGAGVAIGRVEIAFGEK